MVYIYTLQLQNLNQQGYSPTSLIISLMGVACSDLNPNLPDQGLSDVTVSIGHV